MAKQYPTPPKGKQQPKKAPPSKGKAPAKGGFPPEGFKKGGGVGKKGC